MIGKVTKLWKMENGRKIRICNMNNLHLTNTIKFLKRKSEMIMLEIPYPNFRGEMAQYYAEQEWDRTVTATPDHFFPIYNDLLREQERRKKHDMPKL